MTDPTQETMLENRCRELERENADLRRNTTITLSEALALEVARRKHAEHQVDLLQARGTELVLECRELRRRLANHEWRTGP